MTVMLNALAWSFRIDQQDVSRNQFCAPITWRKLRFPGDVNETEVEWILARPGEDGPSSRGTRQSIGQTAAGRYLRVIYVPDPDGNGVFVVTAYSLTGKQLKAYRRRKRRRRP
jgi:hypothetical protein